MQRTHELMSMLAASPTERVVGMAIFIGVGVAVGVAFLMIARRRLLRAERDASQPMTLAHARALRAEGRISEEEFAALKSALVRTGGSGGAASGKPGAGPARAGGATDQGANGG